MCLYAITVFIEGVVFYGNHNVLCMCIYTYAEAVFTLALCVFQVRMMQYELFLKEVRTSNIFLSFSIYWNLYCLLLVGKQQALHEAEKKFIRYISHEMRTPLNTAFLGLNLIIEQLEEGSLGPFEALKSVKEVKTAASVALTILNDMLMLDKVKDGLLVLELSDQEPYNLVQKTVEEFNIQVRLM